MTVVWERETALTTADEVLAEDVDAATGADPATQVAVMLYVAPRAFMKSWPSVVSAGICRCDQTLVLGLTGSMWVDVGYVGRGRCGVGVRGDAWLGVGGVLDSGVVARRGDFAS
ncbi:hypothetical protein [Thalassospira sp.]|uniref:hypothetical protein n=1 Tax=Thalassospira sp. TaxID=1912094 RepID=UPI0025FE9AE2|nr:hypothetical protein [Thalassospira sp.]